MAKRFVMPGILRLAFKLLVNDSAKFTALLIGITFAVFLIVEMMSAGRWPHHLLGGWSVTDPAR